MRIHRPSFFTGWLYPEAIFRMRTNEKELCLTFDDGPDPDSTSEVLEVLEKFQIRSVFFCNGESAEKYPGLMNALRSGGHLIGNHGYSHLDGWLTPDDRYIEDVTSAASFTSARLFRPPYGHLRLRQYKALRSKYRIMFWDLMPYDFNDRSAGREPLRILKKLIRPGSVIVLHDKVKSSAPLILNEFIEYSLGKGYNFILPKLNEM